MLQNKNNLKELLGDRHPESWADIECLMDIISQKPGIDTEPVQENKVTIGYLTFEYGIDGVSVEILKYASRMEKILKEKNLEVDTVLIGERFYRQIDQDINSHWKKIVIPHINGWSKWQNGRLFFQMFQQNMPENSPQSNQTARKVWEQCLEIIKELYRVVSVTGISLLFLANVCSNPGNLSLTLALIFLSKLTGIKVINSNHDFYWDTSSEGYSIGINNTENHFTTNFDNKSFLSLMTKIYPYNSETWIQCTINNLQTDMLINYIGIPKEQIFKLPTCFDYKISNSKSREGGFQKNSRHTFFLILAKGETHIRTKSIQENLSKSREYIARDAPFVLSLHNSKCISANNFLPYIFLQPTRVIPRKNIVEGIKQFIRIVSEPLFIGQIKKKKYSHIMYNISGNVPVEHFSEAQSVIKTFYKYGCNLPHELKEKLLLSFSLGHLNIEVKNTMRNITISDLYKFSNVVMFPSLSEGRGLPIIESCFTHKLLICKRFEPYAVFHELMGIGAGEKNELKYIDFDRLQEQEYLRRSIATLFNKNKQVSYSSENESVAKRRFSLKALDDKLEEICSYLKIV